MEKKKIKTSKRGLTFSFSGLKRFSPGRHYRYILDVEFNNLILLPAKDGLMVSRKKTKKGIHSAGQRDWNPGISYRECSTVIDGYLRGKYGLPARRA